MRAAILVPLLLASTLCALALANRVDGISVIEMPLQQHLVTKETLRARQAAKLAKLGRAARQLPKYDPKLLEGPFKSDYLTSKIQFGTPAQNFTIAISSGATRAFIIGPDYKPTGKKQKTYNPSTGHTENQQAMPPTRTSHVESLFPSCQPKDKKTGIRSLLQYIMLLF